MHIWLIAWCIGISQRFMYEATVTHAVYYHSLFDLFFDWLHGLMIGLINLFILIDSSLSPPPSKPSLIFVNKKTAEPKVHSKLVTKPIKIKP